MALPKLKCLIARENLHQVGTLIFLHGENHTAKSMRNYLKSLMHKEFEFNHVRVIYPQAPGIRYRVPLGGTQTGMWYERISYSPITTERVDSINYTCSLIRQLVNMEKSRGISHDKIIIGGYDMGGIVAMHVGYRYKDCLLFSFICSTAYYISHYYMAVMLLAGDPSKFSQLFLGDSRLQFLLYYCRYLRADNNMAVLHCTCY